MIQVKDVMSHPVFALRETDSLKSARSMMNLQRIRHIPIITHEHCFVGLLTQRDILSATVSHLAEIDPETQNEIDAGIPIKEIMRTDVLTVSSDMNLREAASMLLNHKYGCLPVTEGEKLVGIITEADFLRLTISLMDALESSNGELSL